MNKQKENKHYELYKSKVEEFKKEWYPWNKHVSGIVPFIKQTFIYIADREIERLERERSKCSRYGVVYLGNDNDECLPILYDQISYWEEAKKLIQEDK